MIKAIKPAKSAGFVYEKVFMKEIITSRQNPKIKDIRALSDKKGRARQGLFRFDGIKLFCDALGTVGIDTVVLKHPMSETVSAEVQRAVSRGLLDEDSLCFVSEGVFESLTEESAPEGIITVAHPLDELHGIGRASDARRLSGKKLLLAETIRDTGNLGTVMRSCAALGIDLLCLSDDCADLYNPKTVRSSMGALFRMPTLRIPRGELAEFIGELRQNGRRVFAAALREDALVLGEFPLAEGDCFVIGNEGHGLSEAVINACDRTAIIPMVEGNESLNAAAAAAICIWETVKASETQNRREIV